MDTVEHTSNRVDILLAGLEHISRQKEGKHKLLLTTAILALTLALTSTLIAQYYTGRQYITTYRP